MINKRLLIKNLLTHADENSFYDKKRDINISEKQGKAKFLKHICALANSNPENHSYIIIGVEDETNEILGVDFFDDSKIQNLVNAYMTNAPLIAYENIHFPNLSNGKVVGLVTITSSGRVCHLKKGIWKYSSGASFIRKGSMSIPSQTILKLEDTNSSLVQNIEQNARNNIKLTLDGVLDFINVRHAHLNSNYQVFKEHFVVCWAGIEKRVKDRIYYSRVDVELINEQVKLFYSTLDEVEISWNEDSFTILEYVQLGIGKHYKYYPLEEIKLLFNDNGSYEIESRLVFDPPVFYPRTMLHVYNSNNVIHEKLRTQQPLSVVEEKDISSIGQSYLLCYLNGINTARQQMTQLLPLLKGQHPKAYKNLKEAFRVLRKVKYS